MPEIENFGVRLVAISPMLPKYAPQLVKKLGLSFPLLCDRDNLVAAKFGAVRKIDDDLKHVYLEFGIDLDRFNGNASWELPLPGRIIIDGGGIIRDVELFTDHTCRPEPQETLNRLQELFG